MFRVEGLNPKPQTLKPKTQGTPKSRAPELRAFGPSFNAPEHRALGETPGSRV